MWSSNKSVGLGTQSNELKQAGGGADDDAGDEEPGVGAEPFVEEVAQAAERDHHCNEGDARGVCESRLAILFLIGALRH